MALHNVNGKPLLRNGAPSAVNPGSADPSGPSATSIALAEFTEGRIFQRVGAGKTIPVNGWYEGQPESIHVRVVTDAGAAITGWVPATLSPEARTWSASIDVPQGGMYRLQARDKNDASVQATGVRLFGVGAIVSLIGQSNMRFLTEREQNYPLADLRCRRYTQSSGVWGFVGNYDPTGTYPPGTPFSVYGSTRVTATPRGDGIVTFVNSLSAALACPVAVLEYAVPGTNITGWQPNGGAQWAAFATAVAGAGGDFELALWYQGENNASASTSSAQYQSYLLNVLNGCRAITGRDAATQHFGVVTLGPTTNYAPEGQFGNIRGAQLAFVASNPGVFLAGVAADGTITDNVHIDTASQVRMARRYVKSYLAWLAGSAKPGPRITGAVRSGVTVTVSIAGGTGALRDSAGGAGGALLGFRLFDGGAPATISSTAISGSTVVLTLSAAPSGAVTLDYGLANAPYGSPAPTAGSVLYDSDTVPGDTLGLPLQPLASINITGS